MAYIRKTVDIQISSELSEILSKFKYNSKVAKVLLSKRVPKEILVDNHVDYISVSKEDVGKISYLTSDRVTKMLETGESLWTSTKRFHCKPGSFISKIFKNVPDKEVIEFSNYFRTFSSKEVFKFEVVTGNDTKKYYHYSSYQNGDGTLGSSCMRYDKCSKFLGIYTDNSQISLLIMTDGDGMLMGRALLWSLPNHKIMDRIYTTNDERYTIHFKNWATENGYLYKTQQSSHNTISFENGHIPHTEIPIEVDLDNVIFDYYPYLDTFKWIDFKQKKLYNYLPNHFFDNQRFKLLMDSNGRFYSFDYLKFDSIDRLFKSTDCLHTFDNGLMTEYKYISFDESNDIYSLNNYALQKLSIFDKSIGDRTSDIFPRFNLEDKKVEETEVVCAEICWVEI